jgi:serine/threonine protein kinase
MAEVWKAYDPQLHRFVAIKFIRAHLRNDSDSMMRFEREARAVASLHHPNIIQIHDFQVTSSTESEYNLAYMVMAYIEGQTLADYIGSTSQVGKFPSAIELVHLFAPISAAIDYAHHKGMIHRDIKPANILLDKHNIENHPMGEPILTDFGIVKMLRSFTSSLVGTWIGTPLYMSPEQARGQPGNERSDIYSLGVILFEICTGVRPFQGDNQISIVMQHAFAAPPQPDLINPAIPPALSEVILRSLSKDPEERFPSATSMVEAIILALDLTPSIGRTTPVISTDPSLPLLPSQPTVGMMPPTPPSLAAPVDGISSPITPEARVTPRFSTPVGHGFNTPVTPHTEASGSYVLASSLQTTRGGTQLQSPPPLAPPSKSRPKRRRGILLVALIALALILGGAVLSTFYLLTRPSPNSPFAGVGHASFESSGAVGDNTNQGLNDELQVDLQNIAPADPGKSYYVWLLPDLNPNPAQNAAVPMLLGTLAVNSSGNAHLHYSDPKHTNLLGITSRLLITEESTGSSSRSPSSDQRTWRYFAKFSQTPIPFANGSLLDQLRELLYEASGPESRGIHGGLNIHLFGNTGKVLQSVTSAKAAWSAQDATSLHMQVVRVLDYLEGTTLVKKDLPKEPLQVDNPILVQVPLITPAQYQNGNFGSPVDYLTAIDHRLLNIKESPDASVEMVQLASQIRDAVGNVTTLLEKVYEDAKQLVNLTNAELLLPSSLHILEDMQSQANYAYHGQLGQSATEGVVWIYNNAQRLATFDVKACSSESTSTSCV